MTDLIRRYISEYHRPKRQSFSSLHPVVASGAILARRLKRSIENNLNLKKLKKGTGLPWVIARHSSPLYRKLGDSDPQLQTNKVTNLKLALAKLDGLIVPPGEVFSFWHNLGPVTRKTGYVDGMLISNGQVSSGVGGGLCQLSNFLFWILLHANVQVVERHHHSVDVFPDSGRTLPFGSGATIFSNYVDLKIRNISDHPLQIKLWLTNTHLKGQILSNKPASKKFHLLERNHCFVNGGGDYFRYNEIYRETYQKGKKIGEEKIVTNFAPVVYQITDNYFKKRNYSLLSL